MRYVLIALLLILLPVRGWMGNAMAIEMATMSIAAAPKVALDGSNTKGMDADCPMRQQVSAEPGDTVMAVAVIQGSDAGADAGLASASESLGMLCSGCDTCDLCLAIAQLSRTSISATGAQAYPEPASPRDAFSNADRIPGLKPPIS